MTIIVAMRISDLPDPLVPSEVYQCIDCDAEVWVAQETLEFLGEELEYVLCQTCQQSQLIKKSQLTRPPEVVGSQNK